MADRSSANKHMARILNIPHVACLNHHLNFQVNDLVSDDAELLFWLTRVEETMNCFRSKLTNRALLLNLTSLNPLLFNKTRWFGKYIVLHRFQLLHEKMMSESDSSRNNISIVCTECFRNTVRKYVKQLEEIQPVTTYLHNTGLPLSEGHLALDTVISLWQRILIPKETRCLIYFER